MPVITWNKQVYQTTKTLLLKIYIFPNFNNKTKRLILNKLIDKLFNFIHLNWSNLFHFAASIKFSTEINRNQCNYFYNYKSK